MNFRVSDELIGEHNHGRRSALDTDYAHLAVQLARRKLDIEALTRIAMEFSVALPSWALTAGGTRFGRRPASRERLWKSWKTAKR